MRLPAVRGIIERRIVTNSVWMPKYLVLRLRRMKMLQAAADKP
jgi:hypothetical protein